MVRALLRGTPRLRCPLTALLGGYVTFTQSHTYLYFPRATHNAPRSRKGCRCCCKTPVFGPAPGVEAEEAEEGLLGPLVVYVFQQAAAPPAEASAVSKTLDPPYA